MGAIEGMQGIRQSSTPDVIVPVGVASHTRQAGQPDAVPALMDVRTQEVDPARLPFMQVLMTSGLRYPNEILGGVRVQAEQDVAILVDPVANGWPYVFELPNKVHTFVNKVPGDAPRLADMRQAAQEVFADIVYRARQAQQQQNEGDGDDASGRHRAQAPRG